jgi:hypothetical protein
MIVPKWPLALAAVVGCAVGLAAILTLGPSGPADLAAAQAPPADPDRQLHDVIRDYLQAASEQDWERVHDLTADHERPSNRSAWLAGRTEGFTDKCAGDPSGRPHIDVTTLQWSEVRAIVEATVWVESNQGLTCRYELVREGDRWRVGTNVRRDTVDVL